MSKIEQIISEIEEYVDSCKFQPLSSTKIIVNKDEIDELLNELRLRTPEEIKSYQKIISNREAIIKDAQKKSEAMIEEATKLKTTLISEHEIMQQAYVQANEIIQNATDQARGILDKATLEANEVRSAAMQYTDSLLVEIQNIISANLIETTARNSALIEAATIRNREYIQETEAKQEEFVDVMKKTLDIISTNRQELTGTPEGEVLEEETEFDIEDISVDTEIEV